LADKHFYMQWNDEGIIISSRPHGESGVLVCALTQTKGRVHGYIRGQIKNSAIIQSGNMVQIRWRGRTDEHLGTVALELIKPLPNTVLEQSAKLKAWVGLAAMLDWTLPEKEPHADLYFELQNVITSFNYNNWIEEYIKFECNLLSRMGFGLDLSRCVVTGVNKNLAFVSPKSGCAVSENEGNPYRDKLFNLPEFMRPDGGLVKATKKCLSEGLQITGYFIEKYILMPHSRQLPEPRKSLEAMLCA
jgi:DNA repair protein RecO (recombination protein O)